MDDKRIVELALRGLDQEIERLQREKATISVSTRPVTLNTTVVYAEKLKKAYPRKARRKAAGRG